MDVIRKLKETLSRSGLTEEEIAFYISVLKKPDNSIFDTAKRSKIAKDRAYKIFESLKEKKLLAFDSDKKYKKLKINSLNTFIENLYRQGRQNYQNADKLKEVRPLLKFLSLSNEKNSFQTFNQEELAEQYQDLSYMNWDVVLAYGNFEIALPVMGTEPDEQFVKRRLKRGKQAFPILANPGEYSWKVARKDYKELRTTKMIYNEKLNDYFVFILPDNATTAIWVRNKEGRLSGATIENPLLSKLHENIFNYFDEIAEAHSS